jgi:ribonuclease HII
MDYFEKEALNSGYKIISGVDEAGRGPLAGPVVAAAVIFKNPLPDLELKDSKSLSKKQREYLFREIYNNAFSIGLGIITHDEIDSSNILVAALKAMSIAVSELSPPPDFVLIDGQFPIKTDRPQKSVIKGDTKSLTIAAASIVAKVSRDRIMDGYHTLYPEYGFDAHKGYGTKQHLEALKRHGASAVHRKTFKGVKGHKNI